MIVERGFLDHWKTRGLRQAIGVQAVEVLIRLWEHCESRMNDVIPDATGRVLCAVCCWDGEPDALIVPLVELRWIERVDGGFYVRGWIERQSQKIASKVNGKKGGRPPKTKPSENPRVSISEPAGSCRDTNFEEMETHRGVEERRGEEKSREEKRGEPPIVPQGGHGPAECEALAESKHLRTQTLDFAKKKLGALFPQQRYWSQEAEVWLGHALENSGEAGLREDVGLVERAYVQARAQNAGKSQTDRGFIRLPESLGGLMRTWGDFVQRAAGIVGESSAASQISTRKKERPAPDDAEFRAWQVREYGPGNTLAWEEAPDPVRKDFWKANPEEMTA